MRWFSRSGSMAIALAPCLAACGSVHVPLKDSFAGHVSLAPGPRAGDQGTVKIELQPGSGLRVREVTITLTDASCHAKRHCLMLAGALKGKMVERRGLPDVGRTFSITASGVVTPLAHVSAVGTVTGVGNARFGHESLGLTLHSGARSVVLSATSAQVPAFTSP